MQIIISPDKEVSWHSPRIPGVCHGGIPPAGRRLAASGQLPTARMSRKKYIVIYIVGKYALLLM